MSLGFAELIVNPKKSNTFELNSYIVKNPTELRELEMPCSGADLKKRFLTLSYL